MIRSHKLRGSSLWRQGSKETRYFLVLKTKGISREVNMGAWKNLLELQEWSLFH